MPYLDHAGARLFYTVDGPDGAPAIVFSNSLGADHTMWQPQADALAGEYRVVRYDTRGHGRSTFDGKPFDIDTLGRDVLAVLDALEIDTAAFCGLSMGGSTGQWLGIHAPERFSHIVLANTAAKIGGTDGWNTRIATVLRDGMGVMVEPSVQRWFTSGFVARENAAIAPLREVLAALDPQGYAANCAAVRDADFRTTASSITVPVLVIAGSDDPSTTAAEGRALADAIPNARYLELPAAHISSFEQPARFTQALREFLR